MTETVGEVAHRLFGLYDYVVLKDHARTSIHGWERIPSAAEGRKFRRYSIEDGMGLSKEMSVPSDGLSTVYLVFEM